MSTPPKLNVFLLGDGGRSIDRGATLPVATGSAGSPLDSVGSTELALGSTESCWVPSSIVGVFSKVCGGNRGRRMGM